MFATGPGSDLPGHADEPQTGRVAELRGRVADRRLLAANEGEALELCCVAQYRVEAGDLVSVELRAPDQSSRELQCVRHTQSMCAHQAACVRAQRIAR